MKKLLVLMMMVGLFAFAACGNNDTEDTTGSEVTDEVTEVEADRTNSDGLQAYVDERAEGIIGGFEEREMTDSASVSVAGDDAVLITIMLEDEYVQSMVITSFDFLFAILQEEIESIMPIFSEAAQNVETDLGIDGFHFTFEFALSTGEVIAWQSVYPEEIMGQFMTDLSYFEVEIPESKQTSDGDITTIEFDGVTVSLTQPIVMSSDDFMTEYPDWTHELGTHYRWLLVYAEIENNTDQGIEFGPRPFYITDEYDDLDWQKTSIDRLNGTGFDIDGIINPGETFSGYVPFIVTSHSSTFEIDVRPGYVDQLSSPFSERFIFNFEVEMD